MPVLVKSRRNNAPIKKLPSTPSWYFLQYHQRHLLTLLTDHPHYPCHPPLHVTHASMSLTLACNVTQTNTTHLTQAIYASLLPTLARYPRKHTTHAYMSSMLPMIACHPRKDTTHDTHASRCVFL